MLAFTSRSGRTAVALVGASIITGGAITQLGGLGMECPEALIAIGPLLVFGFYLSLRPVAFCSGDRRRCRPYVVTVGAVGFPLLGAAILQWDFCDPMIAVTLLVLGPAIALGQSGNV